MDIVANITGMKKKIADLMTMTRESGRTNLTFSIIHL